MSHKPSLFLSFGIEQLCMELQDIPHARLANQHISSVISSGPVEVVRSLGALQAQMYKDALWAVGLRCKDTTQSKVEDAIVRRKLIRTWSMRGTWHLVPPSEVRWMLSLYPDEPIPNYQRKNGLTDQILERGLEIIRSAFKDNEQLTYKEIGSILAKSGIKELKMMEVQRHITRRAGRKGMICFSGYVGNQPAFRLLEAMIPKTSQYGRERSLAKFARVYFDSHGPATFSDFAWWSGLRMSEAREGVAMIKSGLKEIVLSGKSYWAPKKGRLPNRNESSEYLLPSFDEYVISYSDRSAVVRPEDAKKIINGSTLRFLPTVISDGNVVGTWKRLSHSNKTVVRITPFRKLTKEQKLGVRETANRYGSFLESEVVVEYTSH